MNRCEVGALRPAPSSLVAEEAAAPAIFTAVPLTMAGGVFAIALLESHFCLGRGGFHRGSRGS
jgi:hypothetical protein